MGRQTHLDVLSRNLTTLTLGVALHQDMLLDLCLAADPGSHGLELALAFGFTADEEGALFRWTDSICSVSTTLPVTSVGHG